MYTIRWVGIAYWTECLHTIPEALDLIPSAFKTRRVAHRLVIESQPLQSWKQEDEAFKVILILNQLQAYISYKKINPLYIQNS